MKKDHEGKIMKDGKEIKKVTRWFTSIMAERAWLEEQSKAGWILKDIFMGVRYVFEKSEPVHMVYDVSRFDLPKNPTRREIEEKTNLVDIAEEMGWQVVCHDEGMNYYLAKPWAEGETSELFDSPEDRERRAEKHRSLFVDKIHFFLWVDIIMLLLGVLYTFLPEESGAGWFPVFTMIYTAVCLLLCLTFLRWGNLYARELRLTMEEWKAVYGKKETVTQWKFVLTIGGLERFLTKKAAAGYHFKNMKVFRFTFSEGEPEEYLYMMDTKHLTNKRRKRAGCSVFKDSRDWEDRNNDWQVQSLYEAEAAGWEFVGAVESRNILYRAKAGSGAVPLNETGGVRITSAFGGMAVLIVICGLIGGIIGGLFGYFAG